MFDSNGDVAAERSVPWSYVETGELSPYVRELDADAVWESTTRMIAECVDDVKVDAHQYNGRHGYEPAAGRGISRPGRRSAVRGAEYGHSSGVRGRGHRRGYG